MSAGRIKVVIVDDSALVRQILTAILSEDPEIEVAGAAPDPYVARDLIKQVHPDVLTLDIEMPRMDGLAFLDKIMRLRPMPVVMVSTLTQKGADITVQALEMGAVDFVAKPSLGVKDGLEIMAQELRLKVKMAARARVRGRSGQAPTRQRLVPGPGYRSSETVVAIGASTGGVEAISEVLHGLPADCPAIAITQHMPGRFTGSFAHRLDGQVAPTVAEASDGARMLPGHVYIAPGGFHLRVARSGADYVCRVAPGEPVSGHCPSVDVLFHSLAEAAGSGAVGVILTGMGRDGADGLLAMRRAGALTLGQDEGSSIVYGMPRAAHELGAVTRQLPLDRVASAILEACRAAPGTGTRI